MKSQVCNFWDQDAYLGFMDLIEAILVEWMKENAQQFVIKWHETFDTYNLGTIPMLSKFKLKGACFIEHNWIIYINVKHKNVYLQEKHHMMFGVGQPFSILPFRFAVLHIL